MLANYHCMLIAGVDVMADCGAAACVVRFAVYVEENKYWVRSAKRRESKYLPSINRGVLIRRVNANGAAIWERLAKWTDEFSF